MFAKNYIVYENGETLEVNTELAQWKRITDFFECSHGELALGLISVYLNNEEIQEGVYARYTTETFSFDFRVSVIWVTLTAFIDFKNIIT